MVEQYDTKDAQAASKGTVNDGVKFVEQQGRTAQDIQAYVRDLRENSPDQYRQTIDSVYNQVHGDAQADPTLKGLLPQLDLTDNSVDSTGASSDRAIFSGENKSDAIKTDDRGQALSYGTTAADGKSGMYMDDKGHTTAFTVGESGVQVTSSGQDGSLTTFDHTDVDPDPKSVKLDPQSGDLTMNRTGLGRDQTGTVTVHPDGSETTEITNKDKTVTTIDRSQSGTAGAVGFESNAPGLTNIKCENGTWSGLPGQSDSNKPDNVVVEANGQISYDLPQGIKGHEGQTHVTLNEKGEPTYQQNLNGTNVEYDKDGNATKYSVHNDQGDYSLTKKDDSWTYQKEGSSTAVGVDGGTISVDKDGKVSFRESGFGIFGAEHTMSSTKTTNDGSGDD